MKLSRITVKNYRSIEAQTFTVEEKDGGYTFTLIGVNESGKSSFLNAVALIDDGNVLFSKDFYDDKKEIEVSMSYILESEEEKELKKALSEKGFDKDAISSIEIERVEVCASFDPVATPTKKVFDRIYFKDKLLSEYTLSGTVPTKKDKSAEPQQEDLDLEKFFEAYYPKYFYKISHHVTFWK